MAGAGVGPLDVTFEAELEQSPAKGGWTYVVWPRSAEFFGTRGLVKVAATIDGVPVRTSLWPWATGATSCRWRPTCVAPSGRMPVTPSR